MVHLEKPSSTSAVQAYFALAAVTPYYNYLTVFRRDICASRFGAHRIACQVPGMQAYVMGYFGRRSIGW